MHIINYDLKVRWRALRRRFIQLVWEAMGALYLHSNGLAVVLPSSSLKLPVNS